MLFIPEMGKSIFLGHLLLLLLGSCCFITVETAVCGACQVDQCGPPPEDCPGGLAPDPCGCCPVCARGLNQTCGGQYGILGVCDQGLTCVITPANGQPITGHEIGLCLLTNHEEIPDPLCDKCEVTVELLCPNDSQVIYQETECCPKPSCHCMPCPKDPCPSGHISQVVEASDGSPGSCCDVVECLPREEVCANVTCSNHSRGLDDEDFADDSSGDPDLEPECPPDSEPLAPEFTHNGCCVRHSGCKCRDDLQCPVPECPPYQQLELQEVGQGTPSKCCDVFVCVDRDCHHENSTRGHGESWHIDNCTRCECDRGLTVCSTVPCPPLPPHCLIHSIPEGSCCPQCQQVYEPGCVLENGDYVQHGESWMQDDCTTCHCDFGETSCQMTLCSVPCTYPRTVPGHCCPQCDDVTSFTLPPHCPLLHNCTLICQHGLHKGDDGCYICQCKEFMCDLECPMGFLYDPHGHKLCECKPVPTIVPTCSSMESCQKTCAYGFKKDKHGCPRCRCNKCPPFHCKKKCPTGYVYNSMGCKLCRCMDSNATETATTTAMAPLVPTRGSGCMSTSGQLMEDGEAWFDGCRRCFCLHGHEMCALITCPVVQCQNLVFKPGDCCPSCAGDIKNLAPGLTTQCRSDDKVYHVEGDTWQMDECTQCICHENGVLCEAEACPPLLCNHPVKLPNTCCPICTDDSAFPAPPVKARKVCRTESGTQFKDGDTWRVSPCQSCICQRGQIHCFSQTCPQLNCNKTVFKKGQCCPNCLGSQYHGDARRNGTKPDVPPAGNTQDHATVIILGIMVVLLMLTVFLLLLLLLRTRRKIFRVRDPIHSRRLEDGALFLNKEKNLHLKSTNVDLQGNSPLPGEALKLLNWADDPYSQMWKQDNLENEALQENKFKLGGEDHISLVPGEEEEVKEPEQTESQEEEKEQDDNYDEEEDKKLPISSDEDTASLASSQENPEKSPDEKSDNLLDNDSTMPVSLEDRLQYNDLNFLLSNGGIPTDTEVPLTDDPKLMGKDPLLNLFLYIPSDVDPNNFRKSV